ncbi:hypothetical protein BDY21DRAFT_350878 [Lineolata rhizophorae]|uniref:Zn(2)-C6 fungal-type domain-containing protein n=1 Tax=Lineolata rhizophorae TaxID=578093 RepID=A0A6A6NTC7_9PEZI|nr:hypothetical protein BDY21DRAFT_350878 [Lineolata rhizophorae]
MEVPSRRQHRSCDQCRKGKRACDAAVPDLREAKPESRSSVDLEPFNRSGATFCAVGPCSNCKKWQKECTFDWLSSMQSKVGRRRKKKPRGNIATGQEEEGAASVHTSKPSYFPHPQLSTPLVVGNSRSGFFPLHTPDPLPYLPLEKDWAAFDLMKGPDSAHTTSEKAFWEAQILNVSPDIGDFQTTDAAFEGPHERIDDRDDVWELLPSSLEDTAPIFHHNQCPSPASEGFHSSPLSDESSGISGSFHRRQTENFPHEDRRNSTSKLANCQLLPSQTLSQSFARSSMTQNLLRIYHDSMENALGCWLTEKNCPYSGLVGQSKPRKKIFLSSSVEGEWGSNWSNRICARVCRLDRAYSIVRGRNLSAIEERTASRTLHAAIMAFAAQWSPHSRCRADTNCSIRSMEPGDKANSHFIEPIFSASPVDSSGRSVQETLWDQARHALDNSVGNPSFRVVFANIIFSLTQRPLKVGRQNEPPHVSDFAELNELFNNDFAPQYLDAAVRQMFSSRYKLTRLVRQNSKYPSKQKTNPTERHLYNETPPLSGAQDVREATRDFSETRASLLKSEDQETFNLLFWLGIMFDTLTAAMYQRPPVVSDEDSEIQCATSDAELQLASAEKERAFGVRNTLFDCPGREETLWGDLFLLKGGADWRREPIRWPCPYEAAAETLSDAAPVKVLLFRRVMRLQTLIYRRARPECLEEAIQDTVRVYKHWNCTYGQFMLDCVANHDSLWPRIQSWYVILAGHWHLAAILLADTLESIDEARLGLELQRESRRSMRLVSILRRENALAVSDLARCSLRGQETSFARAREYHDAVNQGAFLTEPWTDVLVRSFTRAGYILLDEVGTSPHGIHLPQSDPSEDARRRCGFCIDALSCLGNKSDLSFLAARTLSNGLDERVREHMQNTFVSMPNRFEEPDLFTVPDGYDYDFPASMSAGSLPDEVYQWAGA